MPYKHIIGQVILDVGTFLPMYVLVSTRMSEKQTCADGRQQARFDRYAISIFQNGAPRRGAKLCRRTRRFSIFSLLSHL
jgi:hypothetical protein